MKELYETVPAKTDEGDKVIILFDSAKVTTKADSAKANTAEGWILGYGFTYRQDWGNINGKKILPLNFWAVICTSRVFVSITEFDLRSQCGFIGDARYTLHNVAARNGGIDISVNIEWDRPIPTRADYFILNIPS